jgi:hypothetical protein
VLLFINLLAAAGVAYLASGAWAKRQEHNTALLKLGLFENGQPLEIEKTVNMADDDAKVPFAIPTAAGRSASSVRVKVLKEHYGGAKGEYTAATPAASVADEVKEVQRNFDAAVVGLADPVAKLRFLVGQVGGGGRLVPGPLMLLADDFEERMMFREWLDRAAADPNGANKYAGFAVAAVARKFNEVTAAANPATATATVEAVLAARKARDDAFDAFQRAPVVNRGPAFQAFQDANDALARAMTAPTTATSDLERRRKAGAILVCLDLSAAGQKRAALVLGLRGYTAAVHDRVSRLQAMPERYERAIEAELAQFVVQYEQRLTAAKDLDRLLAKQQENRKALEVSNANLAAMVAQREQQRNTTAAEADAAAVRVAAASASQAEIEQTLFQLQKRVGGLLNENFDLEEQLFRAERQKVTK